MYGDIRPLFVCPIIRDLIILQLDLGVLHNWVIIDDERSDRKNKEKDDSCVVQCTYRPLVFSHSVLSGWASVWIFKLRNFHLVSLCSFVNQSISAYHSTVSLCYIMDFNCETSQWKSQNHHYILVYSILHCTFIQKITIICLVGFDPWMIAAGKDNWPALGFNILWQFHEGISTHYGGVWK